MTVQKRNLFGTNDAVPCGSSGDGAAYPSQVDPNTGVVNPNYRTPPVSPRQSTDGAFNGGVHVCSGNYDQVRDIRQSEADYRGSWNQSAGVYAGGAAAIPNFGRPEMHHEMVRTGDVPADSNYQPTTTVGGPQADHDFIIRRGGADDPFTWPYGAGGRPVA